MLLRPASSRIGGAGTAGATAPGEAGAGAGFSGDGISLREAIIAANATAGTDYIYFNIAGTGVHTINVASALPAITAALQALPADAVAHVVVEVEGALQRRFWRTGSGTASVCEVNCRRGRKVPRAAGSAAERTA